MIDGEEKQDKRTRMGKIARLPLQLREDLCARLLANQPGRIILPWLNELPEAKEVLLDFGGEPITDQNLSNWRKGGFQDWLGRRERIQRVKELAKFATGLATANNSSIAEGAAAIASGKILEMLEAVDGAMKPEDLSGVIENLVGLRMAESQAKRVQLDHEKLKRKDREIDLAEQKFMREGGEQLLKLLDDQRARDIANSPASYEQKIQSAAELMFGDLWRKHHPPQ